MTRSVTLLGLMLAISALLLECVDTSPIDFVPEARDAGQSDGPIDPLCNDCLRGEEGPCWSVYEPCSAIPVCVLVMDCLFEGGCWAPPDIAARISCGLPCLERYGVLAGNDATVTALGQINVCRVNSCGDACTAR
jgi:hypothetical protein